MAQSEDDIDSCIRFDPGLIENMRSRNQATISADEISLRVNRGLQAIQCSNNGRGPSFENPRAGDDTDFAAAIASLTITNNNRINAAPLGSLNHQDGRQGDHSWVPRPPAAEYELNRLTTYRNWPSTAPVTPQALARAGFFYTGRDDVVECYSCQGQIRDFEYGDTAMGEHKKHFPRCPFVKNSKNHGNVPMAGTPDFSKVSSSSEPAGATGATGFSNELKEKEASLFTAKDAEKLEASGKDKKGNGGKNQVTKKQNEKPSPKSNEQNPVNAADKQTKNVFKSEFKRLLSYQNWPESSHGNPRECAKAGFFFSGRDDIVQCFACYGKIGRFKKGDSPMVEHNRHFPSCPFVLGLNVGNEPITSVQLASALQAIKYKEQSMFGHVAQKQQHQSAGGQLSQTAKPTADWGPGQNQKTQKRVLSKVRHPQFSSEQVRLESYEKWPPSVGIAPIQLARAGFFYTGSNDSCKCFYCDGGLKNWEPKDEPWMEHARWFPRCEWLVQQRGQAYVDYVVHNFPPPRVSAEVLSAGGYRKKFGSGGSDSSEDEAGKFQTANSAAPSPGADPSDAREPEAGVARTAPAANKATQGDGVEAMMKMRMTQTAKDMGFSTGLIRAVLHQRWNTVRKQFANAQDLLEAIFEAEAEGIEPEDDPVPPEEGASASAAATAKGYGNDNMSQLLNDLKNVTLVETRSASGSASGSSGASDLSSSQFAVVSDVDILDIVETFQLSNLNDVYAHLGLRDKDIEDAKLMDMHSPKKQAKNILHLWLNRNGEEATRGAFIKAMEKCPDCRASLEQLRRRWNMSGSGSTSPQTMLLGVGNTGSSVPGEMDPPLPATVLEIKREMDRMRDSQLCKICMDNDMSTVFLPCNHMVACDECAQALSSCPICRKKIRNVVHIYKT